MSHIDKTFELIIENALRHESLYPQPRTIVPKEEPKS